MQRYISLRITFFSPKYSCRYISYSNQNKKENLFSHSSDYYQWNRCNSTNTHFHIWEECKEGNNNNNNNNINRISHIDPFVSKQRDPFVKKKYSYRFFIQTKQTNSPNIFSEIWKIPVVQCKNGNHQENEKKQEKKSISKKTNRVFVEPLIIGSQTKWKPTNHSLHRGPSLISHKRRVSFLRKTKISEQIQNVQQQQQQQQQQQPHTCTSLEQKKEQKERSSTCTEVKKRFVCQSSNSFTEEQEEKHSNQFKYQKNYNLQNSYVEYKHTYEYKRNDAYNKEIEEMNEFFTKLQVLYRDITKSKKKKQMNTNQKILLYIFTNFIKSNNDLKKRTLYSFAFMLGSKIAVLCTPIFISSFIENVSLEQSSLNYQNNLHTSSLFLLGSYVLSRILSSGLTELRNCLFSTISQRIATHVSRLFFFKIHNLELSYILSKNFGELSFIFNRGCKSITSLLNVIVFQILPIMVEFLLYLIILTYKIHYSVSLVTLLNMLLYVLFTTIVTKKRTIIRKNMNRAEQNTANLFMDSVQNIEQVKYYTNEMHELHKFVKEQTRYEKEAINVQKTLSFLNMGQQMILNFNLLICMYITYINVTKDLFPFSYLILVNTLLFQLAIPLNMFGTIYRETKLGLVDIESMIHILVKNGNKIKNGDGNKIHRGIIEFDNISFGYAQEENHNASKEETQLQNNQKQNLEKKENIFQWALWKKWKKKKKKEIPNTINPHTEIQKTIKEANKNIQYLFQNFSCKIEEGEKVGIVGKSGSGKSTLLKLLFRFYDVQNGNIYIDGIHIQDIHPEVIRNQIGIVPQDTILFNNTIEYNLRYGNFEKTYDEMIQASIKAELHPKVMNMEHRYNTIVGDRGTKLSKGEMQRICIARCFLKNAKIIVLDEHFSSLDNINKKSIEKALDNLCKGKTTLVITHLLEDLKNMNKILFFSDRKIYIGTHQQLMETNKNYELFYTSKNVRSPNFL